MVEHLWLILLGFILLVKGADYLVQGAAGIAKKFHLSEMIIGLTIVAIGTSTPEIFITIKSSLEGRADLIIGNAIGSCICNFLLVIGIAAVIRPLKIDARISKVHIPIGIGAMFLLLVLGNTATVDGHYAVTRVQGILLLVCTAGYIIYTIIEEKMLIDKEGVQEKIETTSEIKERTMGRIILYIALGVLGLKYGSDFVVDNAVAIAERFGIPEGIISMTVIACGTALPEIVTSIVASVKNESDLILGNVSGSNILNLCLLIGLGAVINPLLFSQIFNASLVLLILITVILLLISTANKDSLITRTQGILLMAIYGIYVFRLF